MSRSSRTGSLLFLLGDGEQSVHCELLRCFGQDLVAKDDDLDSMRCDGCRHLRHVDGRRRRWVGHQRLGDGKVIREFLTHRRRCLRATACSARVVTPLDPQNLISSSKFFVPWSQCFLNVLGRTALHVDLLVFFVGPVPAPVERACPPRDQRCERRRAASSFTSSCVSPSRSWSASISRARATSCSPRRRSASARSGSALSASHDAASRRDHVLRSGVANPSELAASPAIR